VHELESELKESLERGDLLASEVEDLTATLENVRARSFVNFYAGITLHNSGTGTSVGDWANNTNMGNGIYRIPLADYGVFLTDSPRAIVVQQPGGFPIYGTWAHSLKLSDDYEWGVTNAVNLTSYLDKSTEHVQQVALRNPRAYTGSVELRLHGSIPWTYYQGGIMWMDPGNYPGKPTFRYVHHFSTSSQTQAMNATTQYSTSLA